MTLEVHCINSGQGNSVALRLPDEAFMIVDIDCHGDTPVDPVDYLKELVPEEYDAEEGRYDAFFRQYNAASSSRWWLT